jgi:hypothetical protein
VTATARPGGAGTRFHARGVYAIAGESGPWKYLGQATYLDDDGREVEHDWVRMVQDDREHWCPPDAVRELQVDAMPLHVIADDPQDNRAA